MAAMDAEADMAGQALEEVVQVGQSPKKEKSSVENASEPSSEEKEGPSVVSVRTNLQETAFFYPHLQTDKEGNVSFSFTSPTTPHTYTYIDLFCNNSRSLLQ